MLCYHFNSHSLLYVWISRNTLYVMLSFQQTLFVLCKHYKRYSFHHSSLTMPQHRPVCCCYWQRKHVKVRRKRTQMKKWHTSNDLNWKSLNKQTNPLNVFVTSSHTNVTSKLQWLTFRQFKISHHQHVTTFHFIWKIRTKWHNFLNTSGHCTAGPTFLSSSEIRIVLKHT
jgi:hypothetical protein